LEEEEQLPVDVPVEIPGVVCLESSVDIPAANHAEEAALLPLLHSINAHLETAERPLTVVEEDGSLSLESDRDWQLDDYHHLLAEQHNALDQSVPIERETTLDGIHFLAAADEEVMTEGAGGDASEDSDDEEEDEEEGAPPQHLEGVAPQPAVPAPEPEPQQAVDPPAAMPAAAREEDFGALGMEDVQEAGMEIRLALFEVLGVQGAWHLMFRNALWLQAFTSLYMVLVVMCPHVIGRMAVHLLLSKLRLLSEVVALPSVKSRSVELLRLVAEKSAKMTIPLQFVDLVHIGCGFCAIFGVVGVLHLISLLLTQLRLTANGFRVFTSVVQNVATVVKVGLLLFFRIFLLPVFLGELTCDLFCVFI
jgi:hypothetical protein